MGAPQLKFRRLSFPRHHRVRLQLQRLPLLRAKSLRPRRRQHLVLPCLLRRWPLRQPHPPTRARLAQRLARQRHRRRLHRRLPRLLRRKNTGR
jgi:hypothetical protein